MTTGTRTSPHGPRDGDPLDLSGRTLGDYLVLRKLGQGGMGQVYLAEQVALRRKVALKILRPELAADPKALERFRREALTIAQASHANIVQVHDFKEYDGMQCLVMEYVEGRNLKDYVARKGPPELAVALSIMRQVAGALQRAGELGIVHRDIKPENILLTRKGEAKVADFGLARDPAADAAALRLTQTNVAMGTPLYMSPEQVENKPVDCRTDIYSFGVSCYYMLAGQPPFDGTSAYAIAIQHATKAAPPLAKLRPDLPEALCAVVHKMMAKDPAHRQQSGRDLLRDVLRVREGVGAAVITGAQPAISVDVSLVALSDSGQQTTALPKARSRPWLLPAVAAASLVLAALVGAGLAWVERRRGDALPDDDRPADAAVVEAVLQPGQREQALKMLVDRSLEGKTTDASAFGNSMELGLLYLDAHRLDDAERLFARLESAKQPESLPQLGQLGRGIVLALRSKPKESNALFCKAIAKDDSKLIGRPKPKKIDKPQLGKQTLQAIAPLAPFLNHPRGQFWLGEARMYNYRNGVLVADTPYYLLNKFPSDPKK